ncbi:hypothetical protein [Paraburkholderia youngii]|uniref:hypothetical protein n=1 Tax=Paraburkholderia youngii TaxID=2782701 RepID=UPI003D199F02
MDVSSVVIGRCVDDVLSGRLRWVPRPVERELNPAPLPAMTPEARRQHDAERKRRQRARRSGKPT